MIAHIEIAIAAQMSRETRKAKVCGDARVAIYHGRKWPVGLHNASKRIGCSPGHLFQVLKGKREGQWIKDGYNALVEELKGGAA